MADTESPDGVQALRDRRLVRGARSVAPSRHEPDPTSAKASRGSDPGAPTPNPEQGAPTPTASPAPPAAHPAPAITPTQSHHTASDSRTSRTDGQRKTKPDDHPRVGPGDPHVYLSARVRGPIEDHLVELIHTLRRQGVKTSKVEVVEMLLWSLPAEPTEELLSMLREFRAAAPRDSLGSEP